jgi:hypothetical protein
VTDRGTEEGQGHTNLQNEAAITGNSSRITAISKIILGLTNPVSFIDKLMILKSYGFASVKYTCTCICYGEILDNIRLLFF